ncbi:MAG: hypothetical protein IPN34_15810 [Planctomycetes bacterium]|nr:hypothetical protein [Planctomycetota bacterium]
MLTLRDLVVPVGGACADLRLDPLDLRPLLSVFTFELRGAPSERDPSRDRLWHRGDQARTNAWGSLPSAKGSTFTWILPRGARDFRFDFHRCRRIELRSTSEGCILTAAPAYRVRVEIGTPDSMQEQVPKDDAPSFTMKGEPWVFIEANQISAGIFEFETPIPGTMEICGPIAETEEEGDGFGGSSPSARIAIADTTELQEFRVQLR